MGYAPHVGFATYRCATVKIHLCFKRLIFMKCFVKKKKIGSSHNIGAPIMYLYRHILAARSSSTSGESGGPRHKQSRNHDTHLGL